MLVGELVAKLTADTNTFERDMGKARDELGRFVKQGNDVGDSLDKSMRKATDSVGDFNSKSQTFTDRFKQSMQKAKDSVTRLSDSGQELSSKFREHTEKAGDAVSRFVRNNDRVSSSIDTSRPRSELSRLEGKVRETSRSIDGGPGSLTSSFGKVGVVAAGLVASFGVFSFAKDAIFGFNNQLQSAQMAFTSMLGSSEKASTFLKDLQNFAIKTPFEFPELVSAAQQMTALGFAAEDVIPNLTAVGDATAALGGSKDVMDGIIRAMGQIKMKGKVQAEEMNQLAERGIPGWQMLADKMGITVPEAMDRAKKGAIDADTAISALLDGMKSRYGGLMDQQAKTFQGAMSNLKDGATQAIAKGFKPLFDWVTKIALALADYLGSDDFQKWSNMVANGIQSVIEKLMALGSWVDRAVNSIGGWKRLLAGVAAVAGTILAAFAFNKIVAGIKSVRVAVKTLFALFTTNPIVLALVLIAGALIAAYKKFEWFRDAVDGVVSWFTDTLLPGVVDGVSAFLNAFNDEAPTSEGGFVGWMQDMGNRVQDVWENIIQPVFEAVQDGLAAFITGISGNAPDANSSGFVKWFNDAGAAIRATWDNIIYPFLVEVGNGVSSFFDGVGGESADPGSSTLVRFMNGLGGAVNLVWNGVIVPIFTAVKEGITGFIDGLRGGEANPADSAVVKTFTGIGSAINDVWVGVIQPIFDTIKTGVTSFADGFSGENKEKLEGFNDVLSTMGGIAKDISGFMEDIVGWVQDAIDKISELSGAVGGADKDVEKSIGKSNKTREVPGGNFIKNESLVTSLLGVYETLNWFRKDIIEPWLVWALSSGPKIGEALGNLFSVIGGGFKLGANLLPGAQMLAQIPGLLDTIGPNIVDAGGTIVDALSNFFGSFQEVFEGANDIVRGILDEFIGLFTLDPEKFFGGMQSMLEGLSKMISGFLTGMMGVIGGILRVIWDMLVNAWDSTIGPAASEMWSSITGWFSDKFGSLSDFFAPLITGAIGWGVDLIAGLREGIAKKWVEVTTWLSETKDKIVDKFNNAKNWLLDAGKKLITGFLDGIKSKFEDVKSKLGELTDFLPDWKGPAARDKKLLYRSGQLIIGGFVKGLESQYSSVKSSLTGLTSDVGSSFNGLSGVSDTISTMVNAIGGNKLAQAVDGLVSGAQSSVVALSSVFDQIDPSNGMNALLRQFDDFGNSLNDTWTELWSKFQGNIESSSVTDSMGRLVDSFAVDPTKISTNMGGLQDGLGDAVSGAKSEVGGMSTDILSGLMSGLTAEQAGFISSIRDMVNKIIPEQFRQVQGAKRQGWGVQAWEDGSARLTMNNGQQAHLWNTQGSSYNGPGNPYAQGQITPGLHIENINITEAADGRRTANETVNAFRDQVHMMPS